MKKVIKVAEIKKFAKEHNAVEFEKFCNDNAIHVSWVEIEDLLNYNEGFYNVELIEYDLGLLFCDGILEEMYSLIEAQ